MRNLFNTQADVKKRFILWDNNLKKFPINQAQKDQEQEFIVTSVGHNNDQAVTFQI